MADTFSEIDECNPISHSPLTLSELASMKTALNILLIELNEVYSARNLPIKMVDFKMSTGMTLVSPKIRKMIDIWLYPIARQLDRWVEYLIEVSNIISYKQIYLRLNLIAFGGNGVINLKDSVLNFLKDDTLDIAVRFEIACVHCVEQQVDLFWPLVKDNLNIEFLQFDNDFMVYYWIYRNQGELGRVPLQEFNRIELLIDKCSRKNLSLAVEYFFTLLDPLNQLDEGYYLFGRNEGAGKSARYLLSNFSSPLQRHILNNHNTDILYAFVVNYEPVQYVVRCWLYIRNMITIESYFSNVIVKLLKFRQNLENMEALVAYKYIEIVLAKIWSDTPPDFKSTLNINLSKILLEWENCAGIFDRVKNRGFPLRGFHRDIEFLLSVLSDVEVEVRDKCWMKSWPKWIENVPPSKFDELIKLCLRNTEAIENFKRTLPQTQVFLNYYDKLMRRGCYDELNEFICSLYPNDDQIFEIKSFLVPPGIKFFLNVRPDFNEYSKYIDIMFPNNTLPRDLADQVISSDKILDDLCEKLIITGFEEVEFVISLLPSDRRVEFKSKILEFFKRSVINDKLYPFDGPRWRKILMVCCNNDQQRFDDFLKSVPILDVFETRFNEIWNRARHNYANILHPYVNRDLKKILVWYFDSKEMYERFIEGKIEYYGAIDEADIRRVFGLPKELVIENIRKLFL